MLAPMEPILLLAVVAAIGGASWYFTGRHQRRIKKAIRNAPLVPIREASEGATIRITGTLFEGERLLTAPLSGRPCCAWHLRVIENQGKTSREVVNLHESVDFLIEDATGRASVNGVALNFVAEADSQGSSGMMSAMFSGESHHKLKAFLEARGIPVTSMGLPRSFRYWEGVLEPGERASVVGRATWLRDPSKAAGYRTDGRFLRIEASDDGQVLATDDGSTISRS